MKPISIAGFEAAFDRDADPWRTFSARDEAVKRAAILHGLGPGPVGRVLELGAGAGANSRALAPRALRLDATDGALSAVHLIDAALGHAPRARALHLPLPGRPPRVRYDAVVVAELLYYLSPRDMTRVARDVAQVLGPSGRLVLAHHHVDFHDFSQHAQGLHARFLRATRAQWRGRFVARTRRWRVAALIRTSDAAPMQMGASASIGARCDAGNALAG